jgi:aryl-alcohol dehydrogenase-like predicted oxidoreductase
MERRRIGQLEVSVVGLGCNNFGRRIDARDSEKVVNAALEAGVDYFDTADVYGHGKSEEFLARALGDRRGGVALATKFGAPGSAEGGLTGGHPDWVRTACERSLKRLGTDHIDHYQLHFPDTEVPIAETLGALHELVEEGKVRELGCSNFGSTRLFEAADAVKAGPRPPFRTVQNRYSLLHRLPEPKVVPACLELGMGLVPYFPLESGLLTGKYRKGEALPAGTRLEGMAEDERGRFLAEDTLERVEALRAFAEGRGRTLLELAISWLISRPTVTSVIAGATRPEQVRANTAAARWALSEGDEAGVAGILGGIQEPQRR